MSKKLSQLEEAIEKLAGEVDWHEGNSDETRAICCNIKTLTEAQKILNESKRPKLDPNVIVKGSLDAGGAILGVALLSHAEKFKIIPQKAFALAMKLFR